MVQVSFYKRGSLSRVSTGIAGWRFLEEMVNKIGEKGHNGKLTVISVLIAVGG